MAGNARQGVSQARLSSRGVPTAERLEAVGTRGGPLACLSGEQKSALAGTACPAMPFDRVRATDGKVVVAMRCKRWSCPACGPWLKRRLRKAFARLAQDNPQMRRFYTLTLRGNASRPKPRAKMDKRELHAELRQCMQRFRVRMERLQGAKFAYAQVVEPHKDGTPHIHGIMPQFLDVRQLSKEWAAAGGGYVDIRFVDPQRVAAYLSKYLSKDANAPPKGCRKYSSGGGVKLEDVRPAPSEPGKFWIEAKGTDGRWWWQADPRAVLGLLSAEANGGRLAGPPDDVVELAMAGWRRKRQVEKLRVEVACSCGRPARYCWSCAGHHCDRCGSGSSRCISYSS